MFSVAGYVLRRKVRPTFQCVAGAALSLAPVSFPLLCTTASISEARGRADDGGDQSNVRPSSVPPPIRVAVTESAGRGVFATRPIGAGDLVHTASPVVVHPSSSLLHKVCYNCLRRGSTSSAEAGEHPGPSNVVRYFCSEKCRDQSKDFLDVENQPNWSAFDTYCRDRELKYPFLVKRLACMVISGSAFADCLDILQPASLYPEMIEGMEEEFELLKLALLKSNIEDALIGSDSAVGNAVYMLPSFYNHDCDPNLHIIWIDNADAKLKALRDIEEGEELRICYIDTSMNCEARQSLLLKGFGFHCCCSRCLFDD